MASKIRIKVGRIELEYEGDTDITVKDIEQLFSQVQAVSADHLSGGDDDTESNSTNGSNSAQAKPATNKLHVNSIAGRLDAKTGAQVTLAAAAYLQFTEGKETFTRAELLATMKKATKYYKSTMSKHLTSSIETLLNGKLNQIGEGTYALTSTEHDYLEAKLA